MAVDFLDIAPEEAGEWTLPVTDKNGQAQDVTVFPFDAADLAFLARSYCPRAKSIFQDLSSPDDALDFVEAKPYVVALGFVGPARLRNKQVFDGALKKVRSMPVQEQNRLFGAIWAHVFPRKEEDGAPPTTGAAAVPADAASTTPSSS